MPVAVEAIDETLTLELADLDVVERHVHGRRAAEREAVVVDRLHAGVGSLLLDRRARLAVEVHDHEDGRRRSVIIWSAIVAILALSPSAFWMS